MREDWIEVELGEVAKIYNGNSINEQEKDRKYKDCPVGLNYIATKDVGYDGIINYKNGIKIPFNEDKFKIAPKGCVLVCSEGGSAGRKIAYVDENICFGNKLYAITNEYNVFVGKYIYYYTNFRKFFEDFKLQMNGIIGGVSAKKFSQITCPLSPLPIQRSIVIKLENLFAALDKGIADLVTAQAQLKVYRQAVLKKAFEGGSEMKKLVEVSEKIQIGPFGSQLHQEDYIENGIPLINPMHIKNGKIKPNYSYSISQLKRESLPNYILKKGDVIMGRRGEMGRCGLVSDTEIGWFCGTGSLYLRPIQRILYSVYLYYYMGSAIVKELLTDNATGTTMLNLNKKIISNLPIPIPPVETQHQIVKEIESRLSVCDKVEQSISESLEQAKALRQSILKKAFEGLLLSEAEIAQCKQAADYEPASVLLERIKKEKATGAKKTTVR